MNLLIESKVTEAMERLVGCKAFPGVDPIRISRLRTAISTWFLAMLEGEDKVRKLCDMPFPSAAHTAIDREIGR